MAQASEIEWTDTTWNPSTGCTKISSGCKFCYAATLAKRLEAMGSSRYENGFDFTMHWDKIDEPLKWKKPRKVFVNSMSDLFHEQTDYDFVKRVFCVMSSANIHEYQVLTKRPDVMRDMLLRMYDEGYALTDNIWLGTSVESPIVLDRIEFLREIPARIRFLSCEPLIRDLGDFSAEGIDWIIVGGESGSHLWKKRTCSNRGLVFYDAGKWLPIPSKVDWVRNIRDIAVANDIAFFFKQWGGNTPKVGGRLLDGREWNEYPTSKSIYDGCGLDIVEDVV